MAGLSTGDMLIFGGIGLTVLSYATNLGGFQTWLHSLAWADKPNRCWEVGDGRKACSCHGKQNFIMGAGRTCSHCEASCRGTDPNTIPLGPVTPAPSGGGGSGITSTLCKCGTGNAKHVPGDCNACKTTCALTCGGCSPQCLGTRSNLAFAQSYASYPMKGLIVS